MLTLFQECLRLVLLILGGMLVLNAMIHGYRAKQRVHQTTLALLVGITIMSAGIYFRFGNLHKSGAYPFRYQLHDVYHYYFGAKYFKEAGYYRAYDAVYVALWELDQSGELETPVAAIAKVRDLSNPTQSKDLEQLREVEAPKLRELFGPRRWAQLRDDVKTLVEFKKVTVPMWRKMVDDQGFNPPPSWVVGPTLLANAVPFNRVTLELFPLFDVLMVFALGAWLVRRAFGPYAVCAYLIVFASNALTDFEWIGWDFLRHTWFFFLLAGVVFLKQRQPRAAGIFMGLATAFRVFPVVFLAGAGLSLAYAAYRDRVKRRDLVEYVGGSIVSIVVLVGLSLVLFDPAYWGQFVHKIANHTDHIWANHLGFKRIIIHLSDLPALDRAMPPELVELARAKAVYKLAYAKYAWVADPVRFGMTGLALLLALRMKSWQAAVLVGTTAVFCLSAPANYYYLHLSLLPVVFFTTEAKDTDVVRVFAAFGAVAGCLLTERITTEYNTQMAYMSWCITVMLALLLGSLVVDQYPEYRRLWLRRPAPEDGPAREAEKTVEVDEDEHDSAAEGDGPTR